MLEEKNYCDMCGDTLKTKEKTSMYYCMRCVKQNEVEMKKLDRRLNF